MKSKNIILDIENDLPKKRGRPPKSGGKLNIKKSFNTLGKKIENTSNKIGEKLEDTVETVGSTLQNAAKKTGNYVETIVYGRDDYPPKVRNLISSVGGQYVKSISIKRKPVEAVLTGALSVFSLGKFGKRLQRNFDELFHLFIVLLLENGQKLLIEKNEVINMLINPKERADTETKIVTTPIPKLTVLQMLDNTLNYMGKSKYFGYSAQNNNCQDYIVSFFKANNIGDESDITFIKQDTKQLFANLPSLRKLTNTVTTIGARANVALEGKGMKENNMMLKHLMSHITDPNEPIDIKDYNQSKILIDAIKKEKQNKNKSKKNKIYGGLMPKGNSNNTVIHHHYHHYSKSDDEASDSDNDCECEMEGGKINFKSLKKGFENISGREFKSPQEMRDTFGITDATKIGNKVSKNVKSGANKTSNYITSKKGGLASDLVTYGIPATTAGILGALGNVVAGPVGGVAASALGSKLGSEFIAPAVQKSAGTGIKKRTGRFAKGSQEARDHMAKIRGMKKK
jgi:hypothetical protein